MTRKTPMKRTRLKPQSTERATWTKLYNQKKREAHLFQSCAMCNAGNHRDAMDPHHPMGKIGERIMHFVWLCRACHQMVHDEGTQARACGFIMPEFDGRQRTTNTKNPFNMPEL